MDPFKSIVVDVDASAAAHPALERAVRLARSCGASITIADVMTAPSSVGDYLPPGLEASIARYHRERLAAIAAGVADVPVDSTLLVGRPATALIQEILRSNHDLLIRSHARQLTSAAKPFGAVDMELMRKCPCPVLLTRHGRPLPRPRILIAVNAGAHDPDEQALNAKIVETALLLAGYLEAESTTLLYAWQPFAQEAVRAHVDNEQFARYVEGARQKAAANLVGLVDSGRGPTLGLRSASRQGPPEDVIPDFVIAEGVDLVVMGTVARTGLPGMLIGNTAERVLRKLPCSVLTIKPDGFESPVRLDPDRSPSGPLP